MSIKAIIQSMPVDHSRISAEQNDVIDNLLAGVKLSAKANWKHLAGCVRHPAYKDVLKEKISRILTNDGLAKFYDCTNEKIALIGTCCNNHKNRLLLNRVPVNMPSREISTNTPTNVRVFFGRDLNTDYVVFRDRGESEIEIFEQETARGNAAPLQNTFVVDLNERAEHQFFATCQNGCSHTYVEPVYVIKEVPATLQAAWEEMDGKKEQ